MPNANSPNRGSSQCVFVMSLSEIGVLHADTSQKLVQYIRWTSVNAPVGASLSNSKVDPTWARQPHSPITTSR